MKINTYFTADLHLNHKNICEGLSKWESRKGLRPFDNVDEMDSFIISKINSKVGENDILYNLGDFCFGSPEKMIELRNRIKCKTIHFILGNHDGNILKHSHLQKLFTSISNFDEIIVNNQKITICHYPLYTWNHQKSVGGSWMLHGHCHNNLGLKPFGDKKIFDVGIDNSNYQVYSMSDLHNIFNKIFSIDILKNNI